MKKYLNAVEQAKFHKEELTFINNGLPPTLIQLWTMKITTWENDRSAPNPYYIPVMSGWVYYLSCYALTNDNRDFQN